MTTDNNTKPRRPGRPPLPAGDRKQALYASLPPELVDRLTRGAEALGMSRSRMIGMLLTAALADLNSEEN